MDAVHWRSCVLLFQKECRATETSQGGQWIRGQYCINTDYRGWQLVMFINGNNDITEQRIDKQPAICHHNYMYINLHTVYPKKYAHGFCFAVLCCGYTLTDFPISIRLTLLALWQSNDCPSASKATLMNMDKYFMLIHYERLHNHNKANHNKIVCILLGIYCINEYDTQTPSMSHSK